MKLNQNILLLSEEDNVVVLKIGTSDQVIRLSEIEWNVLNCFANENNNQKVIDIFKSSIEIKEHVLDTLITKAVENKVLIEKNEEQKKQRWLKLTFKRKKSILEILNFDLTHTWFEKVISQKITLSTIFIILLSLAAYFLFATFNSPLAFKKNYLETLYKVPISFTSIVKYIYISALTTVAFHEFGHYLFYKLYKGKTTVFGLGLLFFFLPVVYNRILTPLIKKKYQRIIINLGGVIFDLLLLLFILYFTKHYHTQHPILAFLGYCMITSITIRSIFNLNLFLPSSDGYFVFTEIINKPNLFGDSIESLKNIFTEKKAFKIKTGYYLFGIFAFISIGISWSFFLLPFIIYFYYAVAQ
jgi:hypothetical protein